MTRPTAWKYMVVKQGDFEFPIIVPEAINLDALVFGLNATAEEQVALGTLPEYKPMVPVSYGQLGEVKTGYYGQIPDRHHRPEDAILINDYALDLGFRPRR